MFRKTRNEFLTWKVISWSVHMDSCIESGFLIRINKFCNLLVVIPTRTANSSVVGCWCPSWINDFRASMTLTWRLYIFSCRSSTVIIEDVVGYSILELAKKNLRYMYFVLKFLPGDQLNQKLKLMVEALGYVIYSITREPLWARTVSHDSLIFSRIANRKSELWSILGYFLSYFERICEFKKRIN